MTFDILMSFGFMAIRIDSRMASPRRIRNRESTGIRTSLRTALAVRRITREGVFFVSPIFPADLIVANSAIMNVRTKAPPIIPISAVCTSFIRKTASSRDPVFCITPVVSFLTYTVLSPANVWNILSTASSAIITTRMMRKRRL